MLVGGGWGGTDSPPGMVITRWMMTRCGFMGFTCPAWTRRLCTCPSPTQGLGCTTGVTSTQSVQA